MAGLPTQGENLVDIQAVAAIMPGPVGHMTILPSGNVNMGGNLLQWFIFCLLVGACVAYISSAGLVAGADGMTVFRTCATTALVAYAFGQITDSIWKGQSWSTTGRFIVDGLVYGVITGATFAWFWPAAA